MTTTRKGSPRFPKRGKETISALYQEITKSPMARAPREARPVRSRESHVREEVASFNTIEEALVAFVKDMENVRVETLKEIPLKEVVEFIKNYSDNCTHSASIQHYALTRRRDLLAIEIGLLIKGIDKLFNEVREVASKLSVVCPKN